MNRILILDPSYERLRSLGQVLWDSEYDLSFVTNETLFWKRLKILSFDAVILTADAHILNGEILCRRFQKEYGSQGISLIILLSRDSIHSPVQWLEWGVSDYLRDPWDNRELLATVVKNIREREQIHYLMEQNYLLEKANQEKDRFFSILSHDLKAPFQGLVGLLEILYGEFETLDTVEVKEFIHNIHDSTKRTYRLLENLLDWSGFQAGRLRWVPKELDLKLLVEDTFSLFPFCLRDKGVKLQTSIPAGFTVYADQMMIESVLRNLVYNGIKFSYSGGTVEVRARESVDYFEISVDDQGVGIPQSSMGNILNQGLSESTLGTNQEVGTGLGLQLCMQFIERHGGQFWIRSEPGKGSSVRFSLPKRQALWKEGPENIPESK